jgi:copper chaperone CopZ
MKSLFLVLYLSLCSFIVSAQNAGTIKAIIPVSGNCSMCKARIEKALDRPGIKMASWSPKTKQLQVVYNSSKVTEKQVHEWVAGTGHDTDKVKANDEVYAALPFCCLYRNHAHPGKDESDPHQ